MIHHDRVVPHNHLAIRSRSCVHLVVLLLLHGSVAAHRRCDRMARSVPPLEALHLPPPPPVDPNGGTIYPSGRPSDRR
uniref:Putative secreted protein n=1 Tax=Anopheles darlingi TaxID=43151 RepID=A0A2M4DKK6_ANODA